VQSFGAAKDFAKAADVPAGFAENNFTVPTPTDGITLYLILRDDPSAVAAVTLLTPVQKSTPSAAPTAQTAIPAPDAAPAAQDATPPSKPAPAPESVPSTTPPPTSGQTSLEQK
jgi:hypothetical protein